MEFKSKETPIAKYLANLERRKSLFGGTGTAAAVSPTGSPPGFPFISASRRVPAAGPQMKINFDDTFFSRNENESILHISPPVSVGAAKKRRLTGIAGYYDENENVESLHKKIADLERLLRQTQSELIDGQAKCTMFDQVNSDDRRAYNEKVIELERSQEEMRLKCRNATERAESIEKQLLKIQRKETDGTRDFQTQITTQLNKISSLEATIADLQKKNQALNLKLTEQSITEEQSAQQLRQRTEEAEKVAAKAKHETEILQNQLAETESRLQKTRSELEQVKTDAAQNEEYKKEVEAAKEPQENSSNDVTQLQNNLRKIENLFVLEQLKCQNITKENRKLQQENDILKSTVQREHLLKEQLMSAETEISVLKDQLRDKGDVEGERNNLRNQIKTWISIATKLDSTCRTPLEFDLTFRKTQDLLLQLKHDNSNLKHRIENSDQKVSTLDLEVKRSNERVQALASEKDKLNLDLRKLTRRVTLIVQDRDSLRGLMESYENDFEDSSSASDSNPLKLRISQLEAIVADYETTFAEDPSLRKSCEDCQRHTENIKSLQAELESSKIENAALVARTMAEASQPVVDGLLLLAEQSSGKSAIASVETQLKTCMAENESLKAMLKNGNGGNVEVAVSDSDLLREKIDLEESLKALQRRYEILSESYDYETVQLQNACTKLFGYYVVLSRDQNQNGFRLQNINSIGPDETFIFQEGSAGEMLLLETPILVHFQDDIDRFLRDESSVPGFLAAVTIAYTQGFNFPTTSLSQLTSVDATAAVYQDNENSNQESMMQILATESIAVAPTSQPRREVQIEVEGEDDDDEDVGEEIGSGDDEVDQGETDEEEYYDEEVDEVDYDDDDVDDDAADADDSPDGGDDGNEDDVVMLD